MAEATFSVEQCQKETGSNGKGTSKLRIWKPEEGVKGCIKNGISEEIANKIYDEMIDFAKYAFNKSHAAAYGVVAYQTAYLKYYYAAEFMAAMLTSVMDISTKVAEYVYSCRSMGIEILPRILTKVKVDFRLRATAYDMDLQP